jgi:hypothetical protein
MTIRKLIFPVFLILFASGALADSPSPCSGVDRTLTEKDKSNLKQPIAHQLKKDVKDVASAEILQLFRLGKWQIIYVETHASDGTYLFYDANPKTQPYLTLWSGAAMINEENDIFKWTTEHAKGIPEKLAHCFSYHVTKEHL